MPADARVWSPDDSETPLWFLSCHNRSCEKTASLELMKPSPLPPRDGLSKSASARNPLGSADDGCGDALPKSSLPSSIVPFPLRSSASHASSELAIVQPI